MKWDLTYFYKDEQAFNDAFNQLAPYIEKLATYKGTLADDAKFEEYILLQDELEKNFMNVFQYAHLKCDLNKKNVENMKALQKCFIVYNNLVQATSWESAEILALGKEKVFAFIDTHEKVKSHKFQMEKLFHMNEHVLAGDKEELLALYSPIFEESSSLYDALSINDRKPTTITLSTKEKVTVTQGNWRSLIMSSKNEKDRKKVFEAVFNYYGENKTTYAKIYDLLMQCELSDSKAHNFNSILEAHLFRNNIPTSVYETLVKVASTQNASLKKYIKLRKEYLGLTSHHSYDRFIELASSNNKYTYDQAKELFFNSLASTPADFQEKAREVLKSGFVDVYEQDGKATGAYSSSQADSHPFILLNFAGTIDDCFTVAHEAGHSIHSLYAQTQPSNLQGYTIFVAEIASTFNEHMLLDSLMKSSSISKEEKIMLLQKEIDDIMATFYRQTLFAHYELEVSRLVEKEQPLNYEVLSNIMIRLYKKYYGINIAKEKVKQYVWAYIPHLFHSPFYVYQYATSFAASFALYANVKNGVEGAFERYVGLLKSGGSEYPMDQTRKAGIDLSSKETYMAVVRRLDELVNELEALLKE